MIGIIAILAAAVILVLNPAQLLAQARDSTRASDMSSLKTALSLYEEDVSPLSLGTAGKVYVSLSNCTGLPANYVCPSSTDLQKTDGTGWIPVDLNNVSVGSPISNLPLDPTNTTSSGLYYEYMTDGGSNWSVSAVPESTKYQDQMSAFGDSTSQTLAGGYPVGWISVPGSGTFGTTSFSVMKYDAKCLNSQGTPLISPEDGAYHVYANSTTPCVSSNSEYVASTPSGYPIADIDQTDAATYCNTIGAHLITNNEWQTIAWNAENVSSNWYGGVVGTNYLYSGHNDNAPANALQASADDTQGYYHETNTGGNQRRTLTLSNGNVVWDLAGNVWEWTNDTIAGTNEPNAGVGVFAWHEFTSITSWGTMSQQTAGPLNSSWNSTQGMGEIY
ncbi:MAG TPA: SUMF1/EgtB/PvdO family nonheme iron enzyme, partial [Candidatus Tyrphobacter sp.]|nr:SUMF1/EgtB/PvdO family nonheme iron enzyme [Candidatus Tyrphobacter sp.]